MLEKALLYGGWPGFVLLLVGNCVAAGAWLFYVVTKRYRRALYVTFMAFPFTFYAGRAAGLLAFGIPDFDQRVGLSTFMIIALFGVMLLAGKLRRAQKGLPRWIEYCTWLYVVTLTIGQFVTHDAWAAAFLSIGAAWQYLCLLYLLVSLVRRSSDIANLLNSLFVFSLFNILVRVVAKGESLIVSLSSPTAGSSGTFGAEAGRVGSGALGPGVSYAGYLAIFITLALGMYFNSRHKIYLVYIAMMFVELLNTFTRGGIFVLGVLVVLVSFRMTRKMLLRIAIPAFAVIAIAWPAIYRYATFRGFSVNVMNVQNFYLRLRLTQLYLQDYYHFSWWGNGILNQTVVEVTPWLLVPVHNAYLDILDTCGVLPFAAFILLSILAVVMAIRAVSLSRYARFSPSIRLAPFVLVAMLQWIIFANTTSTSVLAYYPYEATAIWWILVSLPLIFARVVSLERRQHIVRLQAPRGALILPRRRRVAAPWPTHA